MDSEQQSTAAGCSMSSPQRDEGQPLPRKRTPFSKFKKVHSSFKSPAQTGAAQCAKVSIQEEVEELRRRQKELDIEIAALETEGYRLEELGQHINLLHEYNDIKDIGQTLLGRIAVLRGTTTRELYSHFDLELND